MKAFACFAAGAVSVAAFAPLGLYPLGIASLVVLIHYWMSASPAAAARSGFAFGLGLFGAGVSWIYVSLHDIGGMAAPVAALATFLLCAFIALLPAIAGWLQARIPAHPALRACLLIPASWTLFEWIRSWILSGFPWLSFGYAAVGWPLQGYAPLGGVFFVSFLTVSLAGAIWLLATRAPHPAAWAAVVIVVLGGGEALRHIAWSTPQGAPLGVALLQGNIEQSLKFDPARYARTLETYARLAEETRARLIVFPETALPRFLDAVEPAYLKRLDAVAQRNRGDLLLGVPTRRSSEEFFNSVVAFGVSPTQAYHKEHLVPFGEFAPPGLAWTLTLVNIPLSDFSRGKTRRPLEVAGQHIALNVCYEDAFGDEIARMLPTATLLVNVSNVAWFGDSLAPAQHLQIAQMRAIETARMHLTATNTGITAAIDRDGRVLGRLPQFAEGKLELDAQGYVGATPYVAWRDWPAVLLSIAIMIGLTLIARARVSR
ncbi:MAG TPA: apolipoprotein N-acyltransferase [Burkholderiales bacterium]|nr:apolipoprotein N-acyltransferase [Burkholderiales bacterium]